MNWSEARLLIKYPSRSRPERFREGLDSILNNIARPDLCTIVLTMDEDDPRLEDYNKAMDVLINHKITSIQFTGKSANKIHACNRNIDDCDWVEYDYYREVKVVLLMSDDMRFIQKGFDDEIRADFEKYFPDGDGFLHYPDQNQGSACATMNICGAKYLQRFRHEGKTYIYHPDYVSVECDLENQEVAQMLGRYQFVEKRLFNHEHPSFGQADYDEQYRRTESAAVHEADKATRRRRKAANYGLIKTETGWNTPAYAMESETKPDQQPADRLKQIAEYAAKSEKLREKMLKKVKEAQAFAEEINALGLMEVKVNVTEEAVK